MQIRFWGTRGSLPTAAGGPSIREKIRRALKLAEGRRWDTDEQLEAFIDDALEFPVRQGYGGDTSCVQILRGGEPTLLDMGSGLRRFGQQVMETPEEERPKVFHFFMSHLHWDHIMGFPFFTPAYLPGITICIYGGHRESILREAFVRQQSPPCFPVHWDQLGADIRFTRLETDQWHQVNGFRVQLLRQAHHGGSFGYRIERDGKTLVYSTDSEHKQENEKETEATVAFYRGADLVIFDAMYSLADMITVKEDWGHSSNLVGADLCLRAGVKHYCMFHHEPAYDDETLYTILQETRRYAEIVGESKPLKISTAYDDMVIRL
jgi:phosphoribosyl 1,2-cyclic phosphodiesterase